jgi:hypothetical protein
MFAQGKTYTAPPIRAPRTELTLGRHLMQWRMLGVGLCVRYMLLVTQRHGYKELLAADMFGSLFYRDTIGYHCDRTDIRG